VRPIRATWRNGEIILAQPVDWPDGTTLLVEPIETPQEYESEGDQLGNDPASIARWIAAYEILPPVSMTELEEAEWRAARRDMKEHTIAEMSKFSLESQS
jgi:hypothetical protein